MHQSHEGLRYSERDVLATKCSNVEMIVSTGEQAPFREECFNFVSCANVIDLVPSPNELVDGCVRVLKRGGRLLLTDPYYWATGDGSVDAWYQVDSGTSARGLREHLTNRKQGDIESIEGQDHVLWPLRVNDRLFHMYLNDVLIAKKRK